MKNGMRISRGGRNLASRRRQLSHSQRRPLKARIRPPLVDYVAAAEPIG